MRLSRSVGALAVLVAGQAIAAEPLFPQLQKVGQEFTFLINADAHVSREPRGGRPGHSHNELLRRFVEEANALSPQPAFVIFNGDIYEREAAPQTTDTLVAILRNLKPLPVAVTGNHDVRDFDVDRIFRPVQKALNGTTGDTFSFDCGRWHFVVMPTRELLPTPEKENAFLDWLDNDLKTSRERPTMAFTHYHVLPVGTSQLEFYAYSIRYKNRLLDTLAQYGNVRYLFSGHVHAGIQSSVKTAWNYRGINVVIAPSPVKPRPFGEEYPEFTTDGGYWMAVHVRGEDVRLVGRQIGTSAEHVYPTAFRKYEPGIDPRCLTAVWDMPAASQLENGGFENGMRSWNAPYRYITDKEPGYGWVATDEKAASGKLAARLHVREKGQGWALGEFTEIYQVVRVTGSSPPVLTARYYPGPAVTGGGYIWAAGFKGRNARCLMMLQWGPKMREKHTLLRVADYVLTAGERGAPGIAELSRLHRAWFWKLPAPGAGWHELRIHLAEAMGRAAGDSGVYASLGLDRVIVGAGVWCSDDPGSSSVAWFDDIGLDCTPASADVTLDGKDLDVKQAGLELFVEPGQDSRKRK